MMVVERIAEVIRTALPGVTVYSYEAPTNATVPFVVVSLNRATQGEVSLSVADTSTTVDILTTATAGTVSGAVRLSEQVREAVSLPNGDRDLGDGWAVRWLRLEVAQLDDGFVIPGTKRNAGFAVEAYRAFKG